MNNRLIKLKAILKKKGIDALFVTEPLNIYYLSGFRTDASSLLVSQNADFIITDFRYKEDAEEIADFQVKLSKAGLEKTLKDILGETGTKRLGFEGCNLTYTKANRLTTFLKKWGIRFEPLEGIIERMRLCKDEAEIKRIKEAIGIAKDALMSLKRYIKAGITERQLAVKLENLIRDLGGEASAFETIIASGRNSSRPHAAATDRVLTRNDHIVIDFGVRLNGYSCDLTRVFFMGKIQQRLRYIYNICVEAQARAIGKIRPGVEIRTIDQAGRGYIASKGYGSFFGHSLGHGIGLAVHELPSISSRNSRVLRPNMVFTVEPGIYLEGAAGLRVEDMVMVTERGCEVLTDGIPK